MKKETKFKVGDLVIIKYYSYYDCFGLVVEVDDTARVTMTYKVCIQTYYECYWFQENELVLAY